MLIGFDLDGVLYSWHEIVLEDAKINKIVPEDFTLEQFFGPDEYFNSKVNDLFRHNTLGIVMFYDKATLLGRNKRILNELAVDNKFVYITSRPAEAESTTRKWAERSGLPYFKNLYVIQNGKKELVQRLGINLFIDDRPQVADELKDITTLLLYNRPWNVTYSDPSVTRIYDLEEIKQWVK